MTFIVTTSGVITVGKMGRECNVVVCSFDVLGRNSMVCRGGGDGVDYVGAFCRVANR